MKFEDSNTQILFTRALLLANKYSRREIDEDILLASFFPIFNLSVFLILDKMGLDESLISSEATAVLEKKRKCKEGKAKLSKKVKEILASAKEIADDADEPLMPMHILCGLSLFMPKAFTELGVTDKDLAEAYVVFTKDLTPPEENIEGEFLPRQAAMFEPNPLLDDFAENLNIAANNGEYDGIVDYANKCDEMITVLSKSQKPNPIVVGPSGVGKSSLVFALANKIVKGDVPDLLADVIIYSLRLSSMVAGTEYRGEFERRLEDFMNEIKRYDNIVLFIDEIHTLVGAGNCKENSLDAANTLKPDLASGKIKCIGATTTDEYNATIKKSEALDRRFQKVLLREPSKKEMEGILPTILTFFSDKHGVKYGEGFRENLLDFCDRKMANRVYPDKVIDVIDHCGAEEKLKFFNVSSQINEKQKEMVADEENPTQSELEKFYSYVHEVQEKLQNEPPTVEKAALVDYFLRLDNPIYELAINEEFVAGVKSKVVGQASALDKFFDTIATNSFKLECNGKSPDSYLICGEDGAGKSLVAETLHEALKQSGTSSFLLEGGATSVHDILCSWEPNDLVGKVASNPKSVIIIDNYDELIEGAQKIIKMILSSGVITKKGEMIDFSNCQIIGTQKAGDKKEMGFVKNKVEEPDVKEFQHTLSLRSLDRQALLLIIQDNFDRLKNSLDEKAVGLVVEESYLAKLADKACKADNKGKFVKSHFSSSVLRKVSSELRKKNKNINFGSANPV